MPKEYMYPSNIRDPFYTNRSIGISIKKPNLENDAKAAYNKAIDYVNTTASYWTDVPSDSFSDMKSAIDSNSKSKYDKTDTIIYLPLPNTFTDSQDHGWDRETGIIGTIGKNIMDMSTASVGKTLAKIVPGAAGKIIGSTLGKLDYSIDKSLGTASSSAGLRKPIFDPGYFQNYAGSAPRTFAMAWDFVPNNAAEAQDILTIIMKLKQLTSPSTVATGVSLLAPHYLNINFSNNIISAMIKLDRVVVTNISVDYGADGAMQQTDDGMPKHISLSLSLAEVDMVTSEQYSSVPTLKQGNK